MVTKGFNTGHAYLYERKGRLSVKKVVLMECLHFCLYIINNHVVPKENITI